MGMDSCVCPDTPIGKHTDTGESLYWSLLINCSLLDLFLIIRFAKVKRKVVNPSSSTVNANGDKINANHPPVKDMIGFGCWYAGVPIRVRQIYNLRIGNLFKL